MRKVTRHIGLWVGLSVILVSPLWASSYLFLNKAYLDMTEKMIDEADRVAPGYLVSEIPLQQKYHQVSSLLRRRIDEAQRARVFKKLKPELVTQARDQEFADALNSFKDALNLTATKSGKPITQLYPAYEEWQK